MTVVDVQPTGQGLLAGVFALVRLAAGPFGSQGAVDAFDFAVSL